MHIITRKYSDKKASEQSKRKFRNVWSCFLGDIVPLCYYQYSVNYLTKHNHTDLAHQYFTIHYTIKTDIIDLYSSVWSDN